MVVGALTLENIVPQEIELKFALPGCNAEEVLQRLSAHPLLRRRTAQRQRLINRYYDTPDGWLRGLRCALRVRGIEVLASTRKPAVARARSWEQTLKTAGSGHGALSVRGEWTTPLSRPMLNSTALSSTPLTHVADWQVRIADLRPVYETRCVRTLWTVRASDGSVLELALDAGEIRAQGRRAPLLELELELRSGDTEALYAVATALAQQIPLLPARMSKAEQAQRLADATHAQPVLAQTLTLPRHADPATVARAALGDALGQLCDNLALAMRYDDPEHVHQARIGWRRWRSLQRLLRPWLPTAPARDTLRPLLTTLGMVRDLDVAITETLPTWGPLFVEDERAHPDRLRAWQQAQRRLRAAQRRARQALREQLANPSTGQALLACAIWLHLLPDCIDAPVDWAAERLRHWHTRLKRRLSASLDGKDSHETAEALHAVRLLAKRLRYSAQAVAMTLPTKAARRVDRWQREARAWQNRIGRSRDLQRAAELLAAHRSDPTLTHFVRGAALACRGV